LHVPVDELLVEDREVVVADELLDDPAVPQPHRVRLAHRPLLSGRRVAVEGAAVVEVDDEPEAGAISVRGEELVVKRDPEAGIAVVELAGELLHPVDPADRPAERGVERIRF
jgi:hypothetical protein